MPHESMLLGYGTDPQAGDALSPSMEKAGREAPRETGPGQFTSSGDCQEGRSLLPHFGKHFQGQMSVALSDLQGRPESSLSPCFP